jgi:diaminopimelate epimerase
MSQVPYTKAVALGNDFVILDMRQESLALTVNDIKKISDRRDGLGCDQLIVMLSPSDQKADVLLKFYNSDGSEAEACGNGTRCVAHLILERDQKDDIQIQTADTICKASWASGDKASGITVVMREPRFKWDEIPLAHPEALAQVSYKENTPYCVNVGNPHAIFFVEDVNTIPLASIGPQIESHPAFPNRVNVGFAQIMNDRTVHLRVWERGAGYTMACGTGACATAAVAIHQKLIPVEHVPLTIIQEGGEIIIDWKPGSPLIMTGAAQIGFEGILTL